MKIRGLNRLFNSVNCESVCGRGAGECDHFQGHPVVEMGKKSARNAQGVFKTSCVSIEVFQSGLKFFENKCAQAFWKVDAINQTRLDRVFYFTLSTLQR